MAKIVWINDVPWAHSGMAIQSKMIVAHLIKMGHQVHYFAWYAGVPNTRTIYNIDTSLKLDVYFLGEKSFGTSGLLNQLLVKVNPEIIISFGDLHMIEPLLGIDHCWHTKWTHWWSMFHRIT